MSRLDSGNTGEGGKQRKPIEIEAIMLVDGTGEPPPNPRLSACPSSSIVLDCFAQANC